MYSAALLVLFSSTLVSSAAVPVNEIKGPTALHEVAEKTKRQNSATLIQPVGTQWTDPHYWCADLNTLDYVAVNNFWEDNVGTWLGIWTQPTQDTEHVGPDNWAQHIFEQIIPEAGNSGIGDCGTVGSTCAMSALNCTQMVLNGNGSGGPAYWTLQALQGLQDKLNVANELLQDTVLDDLLQLDAIGKDFSKPKSAALVNQIAGILGSCFYMIGSAAGVVGLTVASAGELAGAVDRVGAIEAKIGAWPASGVPESDLLGAYKELEAAQAAVKGLTPNFVQLQSGTLGAATYLVGSSFSIASIGINDGGGVSQSGDVTAADLQPVLQGLFDSARTRLQTIGTLAVGGGGNYAELPHQNGSKAHLNTNQPIAGFFSDGKMLMGNRDPTFNTTIKNAFGLFTLKIVDTAVQTAGIVVLEVPVTKKVCTSPSKPGESGYGWQWVVPPNTGGFCFGLFHQGGSGVGGLCVGNNCGYLEVDPDIYNKLQDKYHINTADYMAAGYKCTTSPLWKNGGIPDPSDIPTDGSLPTCFYSIPVFAATQPKGGSTGGGSNCHNKLQCMRDSSPFYVTTC
ncbi:hypothetical protein N431DRAFT_460127 [Stipitochalara longipes BDJ]|nr:hypothetical protein N431DRAFT_460127 [Stipitochalara longipes BDJ]